MTGGLRKVRGQDEGEKCCSTLPAGPLHLGAQRQAAALEQLVPPVFWTQLFPGWERRNISSSNPWVLGHPLCSHCVSGQCSWQLILCVQQASQGWLSPCTLPSLQWGPCSAVPQQARGQGQGSFSPCPSSPSPLPSLPPSPPGTRRGGLPSSLWVTSSSDQSRNPQ